MTAPEKTGGYRLRIDRSVKRKMDTSSGVSETIGAILLVSIVAVLIAVIGIYLFSQPVPQKTPNLNFMTGTNSSKTTLYLYHNGGDTMNVGEFSVLLDGSPAASYCVEGGGSQWSLGKNLVVPITPATMPQSVQLIYNSTGYTGGSSSCGGGGGGTALLDDASVNIVSSVTVVPDQLPYLDCSAVRNWDCADQIPDDIILSRYSGNVERQRIALMKYGQLGGAVVANGMTNHLNFTVNDANSSFTFGGSGCDGTLVKVPLIVNDKVSVYFNSNPSSLTLYGSAPQIWEMTAGTGGEVGVQINFANGTVWNKPTTAAYAICNLYCGEYTNLNSTLVLTTAAAPKTTALTVNKTVYMQGVLNTSVIRLTNFKPTDQGLFLIIYSSSSTAAFYVVGWADTISGLTPPLGL